MFAGMAGKSISDCTARIADIFLYLEGYRIRWPTSFTQLEIILGDYSNALFQEGAPHGYAARFLSALRRFAPALCCYANPVSSCS